MIRNTKAILCRTALVMAFAMLVWLARDPLCDWQIWWECLIVALPVILSVILFFTVVWLILRRYQGDLSDYLTGAEIDELRELMRPHKRVSTEGFLLVLLVVLLADRLCVFYAISWLLFFPVLAVAVAVLLKFAVRDLGPVRREVNQFWSRVKARKERGGKEGRGADSGEREDSADANLS